MHRAISIFAAALVAYSGFAIAAPPLPGNVVVRTVVVPYGDLNLDTRQGAAILNGRISAAAREACGGSPQFATNYKLAPAYEKAKFEMCRTQAMTDAFAKLKARNIRGAEARP